MGVAIFNRHTFKAHFLVWLHYILLCAVLYVKTVITQAGIFEESIRPHARFTDFSRVLSAPITILSLT